MADFVRRDVTASILSFENSAWESFTVTVGITKLYYFLQQTQYRAVQRRAFRWWVFDFGSPSNVDLRQATRLPYNTDNRQPRTDNETRSRLKARWAHRLKAYVPQATRPPYNLPTSDLRPLVARR
jgi:hypothetical protein